MAVPDQFTKAWRGGRPLKRWRYVGVYGPDLMCCFADVRVAGLRQAFWAVWDRERRVLHERTTPRAGAIRLDDGRVRVRGRGVGIDLCFDEAESHPPPSIEAVTRHGAQDVWTRKRAGVAFSGTVAVGGREHELHARGVVDDSAGHHARHTTWGWSAGVGRAVDGREIAWNLVSGMHDAPAGSERTVWVDGVPAETRAVAFDDALEHVGAVDGSFGLTCHVEAVRERRDNLLLVRSHHRQPFGTFSGTLPGGVTLAEGYGVMESAEVWW